jgi:hypothetical protein
MIKKNYSQTSNHNQSNKKNPLRDQSIDKKINYQINKFELYNHHFQQLRRVG